jgi:2-dehydropantoate 2-reductase
MRRQRSHWGAAGVYAQPASAYAPSILLDMEECRLTEGEHTIGDLVDRATPRGIAVPILTCARAVQAYYIGRTWGGR